MPSLLWKISAFVSSDCFPLFFNLSVFFFYPFSFLSVMYFSKYSGVMQISEQESHCVIQLCLSALYVCLHFYSPIYILIELLNKNKSRFVPFPFFLSLVPFLFSIFGAFPLLSIFGVFLLLSIFVPFLFLFLLPFSSFYLLFFSLLSIFGAFPLFSIFCNPFFFILSSLYTFSLFFQIIKISFLLATSMFNLNKDIVWYWNICIRY